ncbi:MAG TPA: response regulator [Polyangiaceae bacterium]|jgi:CheY-like chemotaxis protein|nr:response regulator [Polyangiaceae bacterium]
MSKSTRPASDNGSADAKEPPLILVVDDFEDGREMYASYLRFSGYRVDEAADGKEALEKAFNLRPDIILMDLSLPGIDGWQATRELKRDERTAKIPIVALTGHALEAHSRSAKEAGCDAFIVKPCMPMDLLNEIRRILDCADKDKEA